MKIDLIEWKSNATQNLIQSLQTVNNRNVKLIKEFN